MVVCRQSRRRVRLPILDREDMIETFVCPQRTRYLVMCLEAPAVWIEGGMEGTHRNAVGRV